MRRNTPEDVWKFVDIRGENDCWPWTAVFDVGGYGQIGIGRKYYRAHRVAFFTKFPEQITLSAPKDKKQNGFILHSCDNRACCNPAHMRVGTYKENLRDMKDRGRSPERRGKANPNAKLTEQQVAEIREKLKLGRLRSELARDYGVKWSCIHRIFAGISWSE